MSPKGRGNQVEELLKIEEVAKLLKLSTFTVRDYVFYRKIPFCKVNGSIRFKPSEILTWIDEQSIKPAVKHDPAGGEA